MEEIFVSIGILEGKSKPKMPGLFADGQVSPEVLIVKSVAIKLNDLDTLTISSVDSQFSVVTNCQDKEKDNVLRDGTSQSIGGL